MMSRSITSGGVSRSETRRPVGAVMDGIAGIGGRPVLYSEAPDLWASAFRPQSENRAGRIPVGLFLSPAAPFLSELPAADWASRHSKHQLLNRPSWSRQLSNRCRRHCPAAADLWNPCRGS